MHRALTAVVALAWPAVAQNVQFMQLAARAPEVLLPFRSHAGDAVAGDIDGDGRSELLIPENRSVTVYLRSPAGWITANNPLPWSDQAIVLHDLDLDGDRDVVFVPAHITSPRPVQLFQNVQGRFTAVTPPVGLAGIPVQGVAVGDIDGDSRADLVIAAPAGSVVPSLVLARGAPGLQFTLDTTSMPTGLPLALWPELVDADGDGDLDVLASNATSGLRLLRNVGGTFVDATASLPPARSGHLLLVAADLDADGRGDCAATLANGDVDVLWGGAGGFTFAPQVQSVSGPGLRRLWPADFDGDGDLDLLADHGGGLDALWHQGSRQFVRTDVTGQPTAMRGVADIDEDGTADVLFSVAGNNTARCKFGARFEDAAYGLGIAPFWGQSVPRGPPTPGDVDGDGRTDLVYAGWNHVTVDHALGAGAYRRSTHAMPWTATGNPWRTELADMDGDGDLDLVVRTNVGLAIAANDGTGAFVSSWQRAATSAQEDDVRLADVDGDGDLDILQAESSGVVLTRNRGGLLFAPAVVVVPPATAPHCLEVADVNGDGDVDVICDVIAASGLTHVVLANDGAGNFAPSAGFFANLGSVPTSVRAADLDRDGDLDLVVADGGPRVFRNNGSGSFADTTPFDLPLTAGTIQSDLAVADLDDDGDLDIGAIVANAPPCLLLFNDGSGRFADRSVARSLPNFPSQHGTFQLRAADIDGDADADLIVGGINMFAVLTNHLRQCTSNVVPRLGGIADLHLFSGPGFGQPGLGLVGAGFAQPASPLQVPGLAGRLELDPATLQSVAAVTTSPVGVSSVFVSVPQDPYLIGLGVWFQGAILPSVGPAGFTNATFEVVLR